MTTTVGFLDFIVDSNVFHGLKVRSLSDVYGPLQMDTEKDESIGAGSDLAADRVLSGGG